MDQRGLEDQSQFLQHLIEERWGFGLFGPEEAGQHGEGGALNPGDQRVKPCLNEPVGPDVTAECPLARDVAELLEGVVGGHQRLLGRRLGTEGSHIRLRCCLAFLLDPAVLTDDLLRRLAPTTSTSTWRTAHTSPSTWHSRLAATHCSNHSAGTR